MEYFTYACLALAAVAALDRIAGGRLGLGKELEKGIMTLGPLTLSMAGMIVISPFLASLLEKISGIFPSFIDFSVVPACLLANDMGGAHLASQLAADESVGLFNGLIVASMMGCTTSFTIPYAMQMTDKKLHGDIIFGLLCGMLALPFGCLLGGLLAGLGFVQLLVNMIPLFVFVALIAVGILRFESLTVRIFKGFAWVIKALITCGLFVGITEFLTGHALLAQMETLDNAMDIIINIICIMAGAFPMLFLLKKVFARLFLRLSKKLGINETAAFGFLASAGSSVTTFEMAKDMDRKGLVLNAAFAVGGSFAFVDHLAFTMSYHADFAPAMIAGKLFAGVLGVVFAVLFYNRKEKEAASEKSLPANR